MKEHYLRFLEKAELPQDAVEYLTASIDKILPVYENDILEMLNTLYSNDCKVESTQKQREALSEKTGISIYTINFIFVACGSKKILADFLAQGYSEELFWDTIMDLKYKLFECKTVKGVWGTFVEFWYGIFFQIKIFKLGRLEFERSKYPSYMPEYTKDGITVKPGDTVYNVHIPSCGPLSKELRMDSYNRAKEFFKKETNGKPVVFICHSWLLYKGNREIFPANLNMVDFLNDWDIIDSKESDVYYDCWRLFGKDFNGNVDELPQETRQQKAMAEWLRQGKKTGEGFGVRI